MNVNGPGLAEIFWIFLKLGLTSFGGPIAHIAHFHRKFVLETKWLSAEEFQEYVALCQSLPGPASSQLGMVIGMKFGGKTGALLAWLGFTAPSAILLTILALQTSLHRGILNEKFIHGLHLGTTAVVALAVYSMGKKFLTDLRLALIATVAAAASMTFAGPWVQISIIACSLLVGNILFAEKKIVASFPKFSTPIVFIWILPLGLIPLFAQMGSYEIVIIFDKFFRTGSFVFGGGHVVLPLLKTELVDAGLVNIDQFLTGYSLTQLMPGPLFTFSAYLGAILISKVDGILGAVTALLGIFAPSFFIVFAIFPLWKKLRINPLMQNGLKGMGAAVVGLLASTLVHPIATSSVLSFKDLGICLSAFILLKIPRIPGIVTLMLVAGIAAII